MSEYLLVKRGLYYRPNNAGYTGIRNEAGRYDESDAYPDGGVTAVHESEAPYFAPACWNDVKVSHLMKLLGEVKAQRDRLIAALTPSAETKGAYIGEVRDDVTVWVEDDEGDMAERTDRRHVSWTAIKDVMTLIRKEGGIDV